MSNSQTVAELVKMHRMAHHETQEQYAKRFGMASATAVSLWESGQRRVPQEILMAILNVELPTYSVCDKCNGAGVISLTP